MLYALLIGFCSAVAAILHFFEIEIAGLQICSSEIEFAPRDTLRACKRRKGDCFLQMGIKSRNTLPAEVGELL